jgi:hypothetical protein
MLDEWPMAFELTSSGWGFVGDWGWGGRRGTIDDEELLSVELGSRAVEHLKREVDWDLDWDEPLSIQEWKMLTAVVTYDPDTCLLVDESDGAIILRVEGDDSPCRGVPPHAFIPDRMSCGIHEWWR